MSNMFEDRMREKAAEAAKATAAEDRCKAERGRVAVQVSEQLIQYIGKNPNIYGHTIEVGVQDDRVTARKKASADSIEIMALSPTKFQLSVNGASQEEVDRKGMIDTVVDWMRRPAS